MELIQNLSDVAVTAAAVSLAVMVVAACIVVAKRFGGVKVDVHIVVEVGGRE